MSTPYKPSKYKCICGCKAYTRRQRVQQVIRYNEDHEMLGKELNEGVYKECTRFYCPQCGRDCTVEVNIARGTRPPKQAKKGGRTPTFPPPINCPKCGLLHETRRSTCLECETPLQ